MAKRIIRNEINNHYGVMGTKTEGRTEDGSPIYIGDIVSYTGEGYLTKGVVIDSIGKVGVMGSHINGIKGLKNLQVIVRHDYVTEELIQHLHTRYLHIEKPKLMTLEDIENELGYQIELVEG